MENWDGTLSNKQSNDINFHVRTITVLFELIVLVKEINFISTLTFSSCSLISPLEGQEPGGLLFSIIAGGSGGIFMNCLIRSTEMI